MPHFDLSAVCGYCMTLLQKERTMNRLKHVETNHRFQAPCSQLQEACAAKSPQ